MQQLRKHEPRRPCSHNPNLCPDSHGFFRRDFPWIWSSFRSFFRSPENLAITSCGTGLLSIFSLSSGDWTAQTRVSRHSTANTFLLNNLWRTQKLLRRHSVISDSTTTASENRDGAMKDARTSTIGMPIIWYVFSISRLRKPAFLNSAVVQASKYEK